jgi:hypothetical protein
MAVELHEYGWYPHDEGTTMNGEGPSGGRILLDEELGFIHDPEYADARLTVEQMPDDSYSVTATIYGGWMSLTCPYPTLEAAEATCESLYEELERLCDLIPDERQKDIETKVARLNEQIALLTAQLST